MFLFTDGRVVGDVVVEKIPDAGDNDVNHDRLKDSRTKVVDAGEG